MLGFPGGSAVKESACNARDVGLIPGSGRSPGKGNWQPTPGFLPGKSHVQRNLVGYSPRGFKRVGHDSATKEQQQRNVRYMRINNTWKSGIIDFCRQIND